MKLKVCIPTYCGISKQTKDSLDKLRKVMDVDVRLEESTYIAKARNRLITGYEFTAVKPRLDERYTHYLMLDSDIGFEPEDVEQLLKYDRPIISGVYKRRDSHLLCCGNFTVAVGAVDKGLDPRSGGLVEVDWCGAGFLLVKAEVFETMNAPWFYHEWVENTDDTGRKHRDQTGEDISFCVKAKRNGYKIVVDADCRVDHITNKHLAYGGNPMADEKAININSFMIYQSGAVDSAMENITKIFNTYNKNLNTIVKENERLTAELAKLQPVEKKEEESDK